jgi:hypothetical protein
MSRPDESFSLTRLCRDSRAFLLDVVRDDGRFPYSTRPRDGVYVNDFEHPAAIRYSINSLLGLQAAARNGSGGGDAAQVATLVETFLSHHEDRIETAADLGLLLVLLAEGDLSATRAKATLARIQGFVRADALSALTMQDVSWMLWGACAAARAGSESAAGTAAEIAETILARFVDPESLFPHHSLSRYRRDVVSFGALTYFLRGMHEFASLTGDPRARRAFEQGVRAVIGVQGGRGEWPWLISVGRRIPLDFYPVFAVHQDSMSMLFLLPALDAGLPVADVIERSFAWVLGDNELATPMIHADPFVAYRSIERAERFPRARRYLRALPRSLAGRADRPADGKGVRINPECRSYHVGWILYAWAGRSEVPSAAAETSS